MSETLDVGMSVFINKTVPILIDKMKIEYPLIDERDNLKIKNWESNIKFHVFEHCRRLIPVRYLNSLIDQCIRDNINNYFLIKEKNSNETHPAQ